MSQLSTEVLSDAFMEVVSSPTESIVDLVTHMSIEPVVNRPGSKRKRDHDEIENPSIGVQSEDMHSDSGRTLEYKEDEVPALHNYLLMSTNDTDWYDIDIEWCPTPTLTWADIFADYCGNEYVEGYDYSHNVCCATHMHLFLGDGCFSPPTQLNGSHGEYTNTDDLDHAARLRRRREAANHLHRQPLNGDRAVDDVNHIRREAGGQHGVVHEPGLLGMPVNIPRQVAVPADVIQDEVVADMVAHARVVDFRDHIAYRETLVPMGRHTRIVRDQANPLPGIVVDREQMLRIRQLQGANTATELIVLLDGGGRLDYVITSFDVFDRSTRIQYNDIDLQLIDVWIHHHRGLVNEAPCFTGCDRSNDPAVTSPNCIGGALGALATGTVVATGAILASVGMTVLPVTLIGGAVLYRYSYTPSFCSTRLFSGDVRPTAFDGAAPGGLRPWTDESYDRLHYSQFDVADICCGYGYDRYRIVDPGDASLPYSRRYRLTISELFLNTLRTTEGTCGMNPNQHCVPICLSTIRSKHPDVFERNYQIAENTSLYYMQERIAYTTRIRYANPTNQPTIPTA